MTTIPKLHSSTADHFKIVVGSIIFLTTVLFVPQKFNYKIIQLCYVYYLTDNTWVTMNMFV